MTKKVKKNKDIKYTIAWEKYKCPFQPDDDAISENSKKIEDDDDNDMDSFLLKEKERYENETDIFSKLELPMQPMNVYITPQGAVPIFEHASHEKVFDLWIGHTNFTITESIAKMIEVENNSLAVCSNVSSYGSFILLGNNLPRL